MKQNINDPAALANGYGMRTLPNGSPAQGDVVGLRFKSGPPQRGTVDHYFDNGNAVRLRMDDGSVQDITTADFLRNRAEPPQPMQPQGPATRGPQLQPDQRPTPPADIFDQWDQPQERPPAPRPAPLGGDMLNALDHADSLEKTALNGTLKLSAASRQDMLTEAARLRRLVGQPGEQNVPPNAYTHPLAGEPAADLGELAAARVAQPGLYQGDYGRTTPESPKTLQIQQDQLVNGDRQAMLFPANAAAELPLPPGMARTVTPDGIFHFDPNKVSAGTARKSLPGRDLEFRPKPWSLFQKRGYGAHRPGREAAGGGGAGAGRDGNPRRRRHRPDRYGANWPISTSRKLQTARLGSKTPRPSSRRR